MLNSVANFTANTPGVLVPYLGVVLLARTGGCPLAIIRLIDSCCYLVP